MLVELRDLKPDLFHAMSARLGAPVRFNGWRESVIVQVRRPFGWVVVAHLVAQSRESLTVSPQTLRRRQTGSWTSPSRQCRTPWSSTGRPQRIPNGCWSTAHLIRRVGRSWRMRCHGAARISRLALDCSHLAGRSALGCRRWPPGRCQSRGMGSAAGHARQGSGELWREVMLVAGDGQRY
jgi:hypothetical protein